MSQHDGERAPQIDLRDLSNRWLRIFDNLVDAGHDPSATASAMLSIAVIAQATAVGPLETARELANAASSMIMLHERRLRHAASEIRH